MTRHAHSFKHAPSHPRTRRAFTLLELILAMAIGMVVVITSIAVFFAIDRADRSMESVGQEAAELEKARIVALRAAQGMLMSLGTDPRKLLTPNSDGSQPDAKATPRPRARNANGVNATDPLPTPRIILSIDPATQAIMVPLTTAIDPAVDRSRIVPAGQFGTGVIPQRLEIVLADSPVPTVTDPFEFARRVQLRAAAKKSRAAESAATDSIVPVSANSAANPNLSPDGQPLEEDPPEVAVRAFRGIFQFRPEPLTPEQLTAQARGELVRTSFRFEWQPLRPRGLYPQDALPPEAFLDGEPFVIARDIAYANWLFFDNGERKGAFVGTWGSDLPAFVELEIETSGGLRANWMFEVGWAFGPEVPPPARNTRALSEALANDKPGVDNPGSNKPSGSPSPSGPSKPNPLSPTAPRTGGDQSGGKARP